MPRVSHSPASPSSSSSSPSASSSTRGSADPLLRQDQLGEAENNNNNVSSSPGLSLSRSRKAFMAVSIAGGYVVWGMLFSVQPPFYPGEAEKKGATPAQYGFVFGIAHMAAMLAAPVFAVFAGRIGPKKVYLTGTFLQSLCGGILFAFLDFVNNTSAFIGLSYFLRFVYGVSDAASFSAVLGILISMFPDRAATLMASCETFFGLGYTIGPALGSFLYIAGGFQLPFYVVGSIGIVFGVMLAFAVPTVHKKEDDEKKSEEEEEEEEIQGHKLTLGRVIRSPAIWFPYLDNVALQAGYGFVEAMLEPHAKEAAGMTQAQVGWAFLIMGASYMAQTPIVGHVSDRVRPATLNYFSLLGNLVMGVAIMLIGPASFVTSLTPSKGLVYAATFLEGSAYALNMVSTFARSHAAAMGAGCRDNLETYLMLTGMWTFSFYMGNFVGPTAAGFIVEAKGFRYATSVFVVLYSVMICLDILDILYKKIGGGGNSSSSSERRNKDQYEELK